MMTKFLLDSGDPEEYRQIQDIARTNGFEIWGATTNPSLIAKKLAGQKATQEQAFSILQKQIVDEILKIVPGAVSAEVYSDHTTTSDEMIKQGSEIASWNERIMVKLPTTLEGFKARTKLRSLGININNTLVFSQEQSFAILLHEKIMLGLYGKPKNNFPCFISPFVGRLDDIGINGMDLVKNALKTSHDFFEKDTCWMLEASVRNQNHLKLGINMQTELITAPFKIYQEYFLNPNLEINPNLNLKEIPYWEVPAEFKNINTIEDFMILIETKKLNIDHPLTDQGIDKFVSDWKTIII